MTPYVVTPNKDILIVVNPHSEICHDRGLHQKFTIEGYTTKFFQNYSTLQQEYGKQLQQHQIPALLVAISKDEQKEKQKLEEILSVETQPRLKHIICVRDHKINHLLNEISSHLR